VRHLRSGRLRSRRRQRRRRLLRGGGWRRPQEPLQSSRLSRQRSPRLQTRRWTSRRPQSGPLRCRRRPMGRRCARQGRQGSLTRRREAHWQRLQRLLKRQRVGQPQRQHLTSPKRRARRRRQSRQRSRAAACGTTALLPPSTQKRWGACLPHALAHSSGMCTLDVECMQLTGTGLSASLRLHAQHVDRLAELKTCMSCQATLSMMCVRGGAEHTPVAYVRQRLLAGSGWKAVTATRRIAWRAGQAHGAVRRRRGRAGRGPGGHALDAAARAPRAEQGCARWAHQSTTRAAP